MGLLELLHILPGSSLSLNQWEISSTNRWPIFIQLYAVQHTTVIFFSLYNILISVRLVTGLCTAASECLGPAWPSLQNYLACCFRCRDYFFPSFARPHKTDLSPANVVVLGIQLVRTLLRNKGRRRDYQHRAISAFIPEDRLSLPDCLAREQTCLIRYFTLMCRAQPQVHVQEEVLDAAACCECKPVCTAEICTHTCTHTPPCH